MNTTSATRIMLPCLLICLLFHFVTAQAYNLRHISKKDGLTNSAIQAMYQDCDGVMWFGSVDGLNLYDGQAAIPFSVSDELSLPGNLIEDIMESPRDIFWIQTNYALVRYDRKRRELKTFEEYHSNYRLRNGGEITELFFITERSELVYYRDGRLRTVAIEGLAYPNLLNYTIDGKGTLWLFCNNGRVSAFSLFAGEDGELRLRPDGSKLFPHEQNLAWCFCEGDSVYFVDDSHTLYEYSFADCKKYYIDNIGEQIARRGEISSVIKHGRDFFIGFKTGGLILLHHTPESQRNYCQENVGINSGIFCLFADRRQDIVWIGTDGQGVYMYYDDPYSIHSTLFEQFTRRIKKPTRCLLLDRDESLWIGTKGDGLIRIPGYRPGGEIDPDNIEYFTAAGSDLCSNSVYCTVAGRRNILWIGSEDGLNYYDYAAKRIRKFEMAGGCEDIRFVHALHEEGDSVLWIATVGTGVVRATLQWKGDRPKCTEIERFTIRDGGMSSNYFFTLHAQNDSLMWFGNRGFGALMMDPRTRRSELISFDSSAGGNRTVNDIFCVTSDSEGNTWFGTSYGLARRTRTGELETFSKRDGLLNNTVHGILRDSKGNLCLSTNMGLAKFDTRLATFLSYGGDNGMEVTEYSDGAFFRDEASGTLYFGGINGFTTITESDYVHSEFFPPVVFDRLAIFGAELNIYDYLTPGSENGAAALKFNYKQNFFSISFLAIDYINGSNYSYLYRLDERGSWIDNGSSGTINFTNIAPSHYTLQVKYRNRETGAESPIYRMGITISPPWYSSGSAYFFYAMLLFAVMALTARSIVKVVGRRRQRMMDELKIEHQQEVYESKLRFFTNIAHEFCTPLTLICGPCNRIMNYPNADPFVLKYTSLIQRNADRLNYLIQELIEFRRVETGNKQVLAEPLEVSALIAGIAESFNELAESSGYGYTRHIAPHMEWNSDREFLTTIVTNLISNAFKYTNRNGEVSVAAQIEDDVLHLVVSNTGRGIAPRNIGRVFDRYNILDRFENRGEQVSTRHGLGLAISSGMIRLLGGDIRVESIPDQRTDFIVDLPRIEPTPVQGMSGGMIPIAAAAPRPVAEYADRAEVPHYFFDASRQTILIIDDDVEMLWFISEIFAGEYNVIPVNKSHQVGHILTEIQPDAIICDVMMPELDGIAITRQIKADPNMAHVPIILISARQQVEEQIKGIEAGAEMYIAKPFNVDYLRTFVQQLISRKKTLKEYFSSPISAYELSEGKIIHAEHRRFVQKIIGIINSNINSKDFSVQLIADRMNMSPRHLYRRLSEIGTQSLSEMIRDCRIHVARDLLLNSRLTIDEIIYKSGFSSRSPFFKAFTDKYGCTPKEFREKYKNDATASLKLP